jgi:putative transposase
MPDSASVITAARYQSDASSDSRGKNIRLVRKTSSTVVANSVKARIWIMYRCHKEPVPPLRLNQDLPPGLELIIAKALEKDRELRYRSAADLRTDLKRLRRDTESGKTQTAVAVEANHASIARATHWQKWIVPVLVFGALLYFWLRSPLPPPRILGSKQLTNDGLVKFALVSDGNRIYFDEAPASGTTIAQVSAAGGEVGLIDAPIAQSCGGRYIGGEIGTVSEPVGAVRGALLLVAPSGRRTSQTGECFRARCDLDSGRKAAVRRRERHLLWCGASASRYRYTLTGVRSMKIAALQTTIQSPWQNGVAERWVGSCRRELLDHIIALNERHRRRLLSEYVSYYHGDRTHLGLCKETPDRRIRSVAAGRVISHVRLGGLHCRYDRAA